MHLIPVSARLSITGRSVYANDPLPQYINREINPVLARLRDIYIRTVAWLWFLCWRYRGAWKHGGSERVASEEMPGFCVGDKKENELLDDVVRNERK